MLVRLIAVVVLLATAWPVPMMSPAEAGSSARVVTSVTADGLNLSLTIPKAAYPRDALVQVRVTLRNVSGRTVWVLMPGRIILGTQFPQPEVVDPHGRLAHPQVPLGNTLTTGGPLPFPQAFRPGEQVSKQAYHILGARYVRATVRVSAKWNLYPSVFTQVRTPPVSIALVPGAPLAITLRQQGSPPIVVAADLQPPAGAQERLHFMAATNCGGGVWVQELIWKSK